MKFKTKVHFLNLLAHLLIVLGCVGILVLMFLLSINQNTGFILLLALVSFVCALLIYNAFMPLVKTYYVIDGDDNKKVLHVYFGKGVTHIELNKILSLKKVTKVFTLNTMSIHKFEIVYADVENNSRSKIYVSPKKEEEFIKTLKTYAKSMKIEK